MAFGSNSSIGMVEPPFQFHECLLLVDNGLREIKPGIDIAQGKKQNAKKYIDAAKDRQSHISAICLQSTQASIAGIMMTIKKFRRLKRISKPSRIPSHPPYAEFLFFQAEIHMIHNEADSRKQQAFFMHAACPVKKRGDQERWRKGPVIFFREIHRSSPCKKRWAQKD